MLRVSRHGLHSLQLKNIFILFLIVFVLKVQTKGETLATLSIKSEVEKSFDDIESQLKLEAEKFNSVKSKNELIEFASETETDYLRINFFEVDTLLLNDTGSKGFYDDDLFVYFFQSYFLKLDKKNYLIELNYRIKKYYKLDNKYYNDDFLINNFEKRYNLKFSIVGNEFIPSENQFVIKKGSNSLLIDLSGSVLKNEGKEYSSLIGIILLVAILMIRKLILIKEFFSKPFGTLLLDFVFIVVIRITLFNFNFFALFLPESFLQPEVYSSKFGWGIASTPLELFITSVTAITFLILFSNNIKDYNFNRLGKPGKTLFVTFLAVSFFALYRSFGASIKSTIFDTTLVYFNSNKLFPGIDELFLINSVLLLSFFFVGMLYRIIVLLTDMIPDKVNKLFLLFVIAEVSGFLFDEFQKHPQMTGTIRFILLLLVISAAKLKLKFNFRSYVNAIYLMVISSVVSISLMMNFNNELEKDGLELMALDATRTSEGWLQFALQDVLYSINEDSYLFERFQKSETNFNSVAFVLWSKTVLQKESLVSQIAILDTSNGLLGLYGYDFDYDLEYDKLLENNGYDISFIDEFNELKKVELKHAVMPIIIDDKKYGAILISILKENIPFKDSFEPAIIKADKIHLESALSQRDISFYLFENDSLIYSNSKLSISEKDKTEILRKAKNNSNWIEVSIEGKNNLFYNLTVNERQYVFGIEEKNNSTKLFEFFKLFIIHSLIILLLLLGILLVQILRTKSVKVTYRSKIFAGLVIVSIIPMILLAFYFRAMSENKNSESVKYKLKKRASSVSNYLKNYIDVSDNYEIFEKASADLSINYSLFKNGELYFSSSEKYYDISLINNNLDFDVSNKLNVEGFTEIVKNYKVEKFSYNAYFRKINIGNNEYIIKVSDLFNKFSLPISNAELDIFLFGTYSFAFFLVIIISVLLANQITNPLNVLLKATKELGKGNYDVKVPEKYKGEIGELIKIFNEMTSQIKKSRELLAKMEREQGWEDMARQIAHEIKNPLTPLKLSVQQLEISYKEKSSKFDLMFPKIIRTVIKQIDLLHKIADDFSSFAKMPKIESKIIYLNDVLRRVESLYEGDIIELNISYSNEAKVLSDEEQLYRVLINLVKNAKQANATKVEIYFNEYEDKVELFVKDNGKGINHEIIEKIFEPNFTTKIEGMGLGLSLAKKFLYNTGGNITVNSTSSKGTEFKIILKKNGNKVN